MSRVDIGGQFDPSNPYISFGTPKPYKVDRDTLDPNQQPSCWIPFCNEVDEILQKLSQPRKYYQYSGVLFVLLLIVVIAPSFASTMFVDDDGDTQIQPFFVAQIISIYILLLCYLYLYCKTKNAWS